MTRPTYPRSASRHCATATWGHTATLERWLRDWRIAVGWPKITAMLYPLYGELYPKGLGNAAVVIDTAHYLVVTLGTPLICSSQRKSGQK